MRGVSAAADPAITWFGRGSRDPGMWTNDVR